MMKGRQMKKYLAGALLALSMILLTSCEGFDKPEKKPDTFGTATNGIYLSADLTVRDCMLADFDTQKYNDKEYQGFLQEDLDVYNAAHPYTDSEGQKISAISIEKCDASSPPTISTSVSHLGEASPGPTPFDATATDGMAADSEAPFRKSLLRRLMVKIISQLLHQRRCTWQRL